MLDVQLPSKWASIREETVQLAEVPPFLLILQPLNLAVVFSQRVGGAYDLTGDVLGDFGPVLQGWAM